MILQPSGVFITLEGIDGSGKTTQVNRLCERLLQSGLPFIRTREPGGTPIGDAIRALLLDPASDMAPETEAYLYAASRVEHVKRVIRPALQEGRIVVCDRFLDASIAYQGYGMGGQNGLSPEWVMAVNKHAVGELRPELTFVLDIPVAIAERRLKDSGRLAYGGQDRVERRGAAFFERVRTGLQNVSLAEPNRVVWLDGLLSEEELARQIWGFVEGKI